MRPRPTVRRSSASAIRTKNAIIRAGITSWMSIAAARARVIDSSIVIRRARRLAAASRKIGQPPNSTPAHPMTLTRGSGSQTRSQTAAAQRPTKTIRATSIALSARCTALPGRGGPALLTAAVAAGGVASSG